MSALVPRLQPRRLLSNDAPSAERGHISESAFRPELWRLRRMRAVLRLPASRLGAFPQPIPSRALDRILVTSPSIIAIHPIALLPTLHRIWRIDQPQGP